MDLQEIIQKWYALASGRKIERNDDPFFRFVAVWIAFNALYTSRHSDEIGDWDQVRSFAGESKVIDHHRKLLREDENYLKAIEILEERGVYNMRFGGRRRIRDKANLTEVASCLYQVRCNLFHGGKRPDDTRDIRLVTAGYTIVSKLIQPHIKEDIAVLNDS